MFFVPSCKLVCKYADAGIVREKQDCPLFDDTGEGMQERLRRGVIEIVFEVDSGAAVEAH